MVECDLCKEWYHARCVNISDLELESMEAFTCETCERDMAGMVAGSPPKR